MIDRTAGGTETRAAMHGLSLSGAAALLAVAGLARAQTILVQGGGAALQQAINTAPVGAVLDVHTGIYAPVAVAQGIRITLRAGADVVSAPYPSTAPAVTVSAVPAGQQFVLEGAGSATGLAIGPCAGDVVIDGINHGPAPNGAQTTAISGCTGAVVFQGTTCVDAVGHARGTIDVGNCAHVSFTACTLPCMTVTNSRVGLDGCSTLNAFTVLPGIDIVSGSVVVTGGVIAGGLMFSFPIPMPGIRLAQGEVVATGGALIRHSPWIPPQYNAIETTGGSIRLDPSVQLVGAITGPATLAYGEIPSLAATHTANALSVALTGEPGSAVFTFAGLLMSPVPTPWGDAWLSPLDPILDVTLVPASGAWTFATTFATVPPFFTLTLQSVAITPAGELVIGAPTRFAWD